MLSLEENPCQCRVTVVTVVTVVTLRFQQSAQRNQHSCRLVTATRESPVWQSIRGAYYFEQLIYLLEKCGLKKLLAISLPRVIRL